MERFIYYLYQGKNVLKGIDIKTFHSNSLNQRFYGITHAYKS
jgi:hypothetical protein